ncbi:hypothetical protein Tco_0641314 [Tanacetum coccineum]
MLGFKVFHGTNVASKQDEAGVILTDEQNDFLFVDASRMEEIKELSANICLMARIQPINFYSNEGSSYDSAFLSEVQTPSTSYVNPLFAKDAQEQKLRAISGVRRPSNRDSSFKNSVLSNTKNSSEKVEVSASEERRALFTTSRIIKYKFEDPTPVVSKTRFSVKTVQSKSLDTTPVVSKTKIVAVTPLSAKHKVVQIVLWIVDSGCSKHMTGDRESNLFTISIPDMAASSPVCLMSKASSKKSYFENKSFETSIHSTAQQVHNHEDAPSTSLIVVEEHEAPPIVTTSEEQTSPISLNDAAESNQEDSADFDGNTVFVPYDVLNFEEAESSTTALDPSNMHEFHQVHTSNTYLGIKLIL